MNRREVLGVFAATVLAGCGQRGTAARNQPLASAKSLDGLIATVREECHPLDQPTAAGLVAPAQRVQQAVLASVAVADMSIYHVELVCDTSRRQARVESAAAKRPLDGRAAWRRHGDRMIRLRDDLHASLNRGEVTSIHVDLAAHDAAFARARHVRDTGERAWAWADARWLAHELKRGLRQRAEADEPLFVRFIESHAVASWRVLQAEVALATGPDARSEALVTHVRWLLWMGDEWLTGHLHADLGAQITAVAYHLRLTEDAAAVLGTPAGFSAAPRRPDEMLRVARAEACERVLADWTKRFDNDEPVTPAFAAEHCRWSARLAFAEGAIDPAGRDDAIRRHAARAAAILRLFDQRRTTSERGDLAQKAIVSFAIAEAEAVLARPK